MAKKIPLRLHLTPYQRRKGKPTTVIFRKRAQDPSGIDLTTVDIKAGAATPSKKPVVESMITQLGEPFEYHGIETRAYNLQSLAKITRRSYFQLYDLFKKKMLPPPALLVKGKTEGRDVPYWITPQVRAIHRMFVRVYNELIARGYRDVFKEGMKEELLKDADDSIVRFLGSDRQRTIDEFGKIAGPHGVIWERRN